LHFSALHALEEMTLELPAHGRAQFVDAAAAAVERGAWLKKFCGSFPKTIGAKFQAVRAERLRIFLRLKLHIREERAIAAQAALDAEGRDGFT
jgi:hypothetical protein